MGSTRGVNYEHFIGTVIEIQCQNNLDWCVPVYDDVHSDRQNMACTAQDFHPENGKRFPSRRFNLETALWHNPEDFNLHHLENIKYHTVYKWLGMYCFASTKSTGGMAIQEVGKSLDTTGNVECQLTVAPSCVLSSTLHIFPPVTGQSPSPVVLNV